MFAAIRQFFPFRTNRRVLVLSLVVAGIAGGATLFQRGPTHVELPLLVDREVILANGDTLFVQRHELTISEWNTCVTNKGCTQELRARPDQDPERTPATGLSYVDVQEFMRWINTSSAQEYRLPTAQEWSFMAASVLPEEPDPLFTDPSLTWASSYLVARISQRALKPQGSFSTTPEGIADLDGSVWEWTQECYVDGFDSSRCPAFYVGGEHIAAMSYLIRDPARGGCAVGTPPSHLGMRLVSNQPPRKPAENES